MVVATIFVVATLGLTTVCVTTKTPFVTTDIAGKGVMVNVYGLAERTVEVKAYKLVRKIIHIFDLSI